MDTTWLINRDKIQELGLIEKSPNSCVKGEIIYVLVETAWDEKASTRYGLMKAKVLDKDTNYGWLRCETFKQYLCISRCNWSQKADVYLNGNEKVYVYSEIPTIEKERVSHTSKPLTVEEQNKFEEKMNRVGSDGRTQWDFLNGVDKWGRSV